MKKRLVFWLMALALVSAPVFSAAQEGPGPDEEEIGMNDGGPGPGGPGMGPGGPVGGHGGQMGPGGQGGPGMQMRRKRVIVEGEDGEGPMEMQVKMRRFQGGLFDEDKVLATIKKHDPEFAAKIGEFRDVAPAKYRMLIQMAGKMFMGAKMEGDEALEKDAVRGLSLEFESKELSMKYGKASDADKKEIKARLSKVLSELFDLKTKGQELRVKRMEGEIAGLKKKLESRKANKAKIVDQRLEQMTGEGFGW